ncbi:MAG TPA: T9SS type A sorting domain-containing protein [Flavobacteriales bacterium]|nr:T9SS type A sorting domain-containing protein [Flavobacteriales bacterium]
MRVTIVIGACALAHVAPAQLLSFSGVDVTVQSGVQLTVKGDVFAGAGATITNAGTMDVNGDMTNNCGSGLFAPVAGTTILNGINQQIAGANMMKMDNLQLQCAQLTLQQDLAVGGGYIAPAGVLALNAAIVQLNAHNLIVTNPAATAVTRTSGQLVSETGPMPGYGTVEWWLATGSGAYIVPFGDGVNYLPLSLNITTPGVGSGAFVFATYPTDPFASPNNRPLPVSLPSLTDLAGVENAPNVVDRFWPITTSGYSTTPNAALTFSYRDSEWNTGANTIVEGSLQAQYFNGTQWSQPPMGVVNTSSNTVTTVPTSAFDIVWTLVMGSTPLPVELLFFNATPRGNEVLCSWTTASERNSDRFTVERSRDAEHFEDIGELNGAGNSQQALAYSFADPSPYGGVSYYRLRQTDFDGTEQWSQVVAVEFGRAVGKLTAYPNPAHDVLMLAGLSANTTSVRLYDAAGRIVRVWTNTAVLRGLSEFERGVYTLSVESGEERMSVQVVLE